MNGKDIMTFACAHGELIARTASAEEKTPMFKTTDWPFQFRQKSSGFKTISYAPRSKYPPSLIQRCLSGTLRNKNRRKHELGFAVCHHILPSEQE